ncbi:MAG: type IV pilus assembly protein PilM [Bacillota bacterium]
MELINSLKSKLNDFFNPTILGLDLGSGLIKLTEADYQANQFKLLNLALEPTPEQIFEQGRIQNIDQLSSKINDTLIEYQFQADQVVTAISGEEVIIRTIELPDMPSDELKEVIKYEAEEQLPIPVDEAILDYEVISYHSNRGYELMLVAVNRELVDDYLKLFNKLDLRPLAIEIEPISLGRVIQQLYPQQTIGVLDIGAKTTDVSVFTADGLLFTRTIEIAGRDITQEIADNQGLDFTAAEEYKFNNNLFTGDTNLIIKNLTTAIYRSLDYFQVQHKSYDLEELILLGGSSQLIGLKEYFENEFGVAVKKLDLLSYVNDDALGTKQYKLLQQLQLFGVSIGLSLRGELIND